MSLDPILSFWGGRVGAGFRIGRRSRWDLLVIEMQKSKERKNVSAIDRSQQFFPWGITCACS